MNYSSPQINMGICPPGWHVPNTGSFEYLANYYGGTNVAGDSLKVGGGSNFDALLGGYKGGSSQQNNFFDLEISGSFWTSSENEYNGSIWWKLKNSSSTFIDGVGPVDEGHSVRCLKSINWHINRPPDKPESPYPPDGATDIPINVTLSWTCTDPDGDPLRFDIYFGTSYPPEIKVKEDHVGLNFPLEQLEYNTEYFWRIDAKDDHKHITEGDDWSFTTGDNSAPNKPENPIPQDGETNVSIDPTLSWTCTDPDGDPLTFDIYFGTFSNPELVEMNYTGFSYSVGQLEYETKYFWKIVAKDDHEHSTPGPVWSFTTSGDPCNTVQNISYGSQVYNTVAIGGQCWLKENLNYATGNSWCYENNPSYCDTYGRLYDWETALGVCPSGWHLPSDEEWKILEGTVDSHFGVGDPQWDDWGNRGYDAGKNLKSTSGWYANKNGTDLFGFTALPGGWRGMTGGFSRIGKYAKFWSSTERNSSDAWYRNLYYNTVGVIRSYIDKTSGKSVRCLRDY